MTDDLTQYETDILTENNTKTEKPIYYKVILLNDDFTPMDFVVKILIRYFKKSVQEATEIMLQVHHEGRGVCGIYPREIAETKVVQVQQDARDHGHPLKCTMEES